ncbi:MAG: efflux transporter outer membrane subunit [Dokdonella sp.]
MTAAVVRPLVALAIAVAIAGCSIPAKPDLPVLRNEAPLAGVAVPAGGAWPEAEWWKRYGDPQLDQLQHNALAGAPSLDEAHKRFDIAIRSIENARASSALSSQLNGQVQRNRLSQTLGLPPGIAPSWYNRGELNVQFQYDFDFWGKTRAAVQAAVDEARATEAERSAAALVLTTAVADTYFGWQADQARLALAKQNGVTLRRYRDLSAKRVARGVDSPDSLHEAEERVAAAREAEVAYEGSAAIRRAALAALLGIAPAELPDLQAQPLPAVEATLPDNVGLDLIARRPDIAANRWRVEAALQRADQVRAQFYPDISLGAIAGVQTLELDKMFSLDSRTLGFGPAVHLPLFQRAQLHAAYGVSQAQLLAAAAQYDATVVDAARDVSTQALTLRQIDARRQARAEQIAAAENLQRAVAARAQRGLVDDRSVLIAESEVLQQRDAATTLQAQAISTDIALTKALGGGYRVPEAAIDRPTVDARRPLSTTPNSAQRAEPR